MKNGRNASDLSNLAKQIGRDLNEIQGLIRRSLNSEFAAGGLTGPQKALMEVVLRNKGMSVTAASTELGLAHSTTSAIADRLVEKGLLRRDVSEADRRFTLLRPTEQVLQFLSERMPGLSVHPLLIALKAATPNERKQIQATMALLKRLLSLDPPS